MKITVIVKNKPSQKALENTAKVIQRIIEEIEFKEGSIGGEFIEVDPKLLKASQYNHIKDEYIKKKLSQRWTILNDNIKIQRDIYSGFLLKNVSENLISYDTYLINNTFNNFKELHDREIKRIEKLKYYKKESKFYNNIPSSMGIK